MSIVRFFNGRTDNRRFESERTQRALSNLPCKTKIIIIVLHPWPRLYNFQQSLPSALFPSSFQLNLSHVAFHIPAPYFNWLSVASILCEFHCNGYRVIFFLGFLNVCPIHLHFRKPIFCSMSICPVLSHISS